MTRRYIYKPVLFVATPRYLWDNYLFMPRKFITVFGEEVVLSLEKRLHIKQRHPEVDKYFLKIPEILLSPDLVKISKKDRNVHLYYKHYTNVFGGKYLLVVSSNKNKEIITFFITDKIKVGETIWQKKK